MTTKPIEPRLSKLAKNTDSSIQSCSLECFRIEVNNVLKLQNDFEVSEAGESAFVLLTGQLLG